MERMGSARNRLRYVWVEEVRLLASGRRQATYGAPKGLGMLTRAKMEPMVHGLFPAADRAEVLETLAT